MGTEAHRETKRFTGMGRRTRPAAKPTPDRPSRRLGAKDLTRPCEVPPRPPDLPTALSYSLSLPHITSSQFHFFYPRTSIQQ